MTDLAMHARATTETDPRRQLVRGLDRVAVALEFTQELLAQLRIDITSPVGGQPDLVADVDRANLAVAKLLDWSWSAARELSVGKATR